MHLQEVRTEADAEAMRQVRNTCRQFLTRNTEEITIADQRKWWAVLMSRDPGFHDFRPYLACSGRDVIGYGIVARGAELVPHYLESQEARGAWWLTGGLRPEWRGKGYGRRLFSRLIDQAETPCWLEVRLDNAPARHLYVALGFQVVATDGDLACMRLSRQLPL